jgi:hypothetical protein
MDFTVRIVSSHFNGNAKITQLCSRNDSFSEPATVVDWLDNNDPYSGIISIFKNPNPTGNVNLIELWDAPEATGYNRVFMHDTFKDYVMFSPGGDDDIFVPIGMLIWNVSADVTYPSTDINPNSVTGPDGVSDPGGEFPDWVNVYINGMFFH